MWVPNMGGIRDLLLEDLLMLSSYKDEGFTTPKIIGKMFHQIDFITLGSSTTVCKEEMQCDKNVY